MNTITPRNETEAFLLEKFQALLAEQHLTAIRNVFQGMVNIQDLVRFVKDFLRRLPNTRVAIH